MSIEVLNRGANPRNGTKSDEAHPPIHPLKFALPSELVGYEWSIYELVVRHFLACVSIDARGQETRVQVCHFCAFHDFMHFPECVVAMSHVCVSVYVCLPV